METQTQTKTKTAVAVAVVLTALSVGLMAVGMYYYGGRGSTCPVCPSCPACSPCGDQDPGSTSGNVDIEVKSVGGVSKAPNNYDKATVQITLKNNGTKAVAPFKISLVLGRTYANGEGIPDSKVAYNIPLATADVDRIDAGQTITKEMPVVFKSLSIHSSYKIRATADPDNQITETNEGNNIGHSINMYFSR